MHVAIFIFIHFLKHSSINLSVFVTNENAKLF